MLSFLGVGIDPVDIRVGGLITLDGLAMVVQIDPALLPDVGCIFLAITSIDFSSDFSAGVIGDDCFDASSGPLDVVFNDGGIFVVNMGPVPTDPFTFFLQVDILGPGGEIDFERSRLVNPEDGVDISESLPSVDIRGGLRFSADLVLTKAVDNETAPLGSTVEYTIEVTNEGPQSTARVQVTDVLDFCLGDVGSITSQGVYDPDTGLWDVGSLKVGDTATMTVTATVTVDCDPSVENTARVTRSSLPDPDGVYNLFDDPVFDDIDSATFSVG